MKIKTFIANNMQEALYKVKSELGKDAVILQTKHVKRGGFLGFFSKQLVEVVAANEIDVGPRPQRQPFTSTRLTDFPAAIRSENPKELQDIKENITEMKDMIKNLYSINRQNSGFRKGFPKVLDVFYEKMMNMEIDEEIITDVLNNVSQSFLPGQDEDEHQILKKIKKEIISQIGQAQPIELSEGKRVIVAVVGPTGVGKTTTIAKLAAKFTLYHEKKVAMITADTFRVGAIEQLKTYGELLEIPVEVIYQNEDVKRALDKVKGYDLVLMDTMGSSPNNKMQIKRIKNLLDAVNPDEIHMVISATTKSKDIGEILKGYKELNFQKLIVTKLDETKTYGLIINTVKEVNKSLSYFTAGQNVPDDIEVASTEKLVEMLLGENIYV